MAGIDNSSFMAPSMCPIFKPSDSEGGGGETGALAGNLFKGGIQDGIQALDGPVENSGTLKVGLGFILSVPSAWKHALGNLGNLGILAQGAELTSVGIIKVVASMRSGAFGRGGSPF